MLIVVYFGGYYVLVNAYLIRDKGYCKYCEESSSMPYYRYILRACVRDC